MKKFNEDNNYKRQRKTEVKIKKPLSGLDSCDPAGTRTQGPNIKSVVLYQLSYEINL
jgi:hypothetical protein